MTQYILDTIIITIRLSVLVYEVMQDFYHSTSQLLKAWPFQLSQEPTRKNGPLFEARGRGPERAWVARKEIKLSCFYLDTVSILLVCMSLVWLYIPNMVSIHHLSYILHHILDIPMMATIYHGVYATPDTLYIYIYIPIMAILN